MKDKEQQKLEAMYEHYDYKCFVTGKRATQRAHIIGDTKPNRLIYNMKIINHILNWLPAADLHCNSLIDISNDKMKAEVIAILIEGCTPETFDETRELIEEEIRLNIKRKESKK